ncbi:MAG: hypothetical protein HQK49_19165 [Oligoflexia bacterium]|nr:hypothetical protein [Oligoflexia bacterium]
MKKTILLSLLLLIFLLLTTITAYFIPFYFYKKIITENYSSEWYKPTFGQQLLDGKFFSPAKLASSSEDKYWKLFHIRDYKIFLPINHPLYNTTPLINIEDERDTPVFGFQFLSHNYHSLVDVTFNKNKKFSPLLGTQKLFKIAIIESYLEKMALANIWKDIFSKNLHLDINNKKRESIITNSSGNTNEFFLKNWYNTSYTKIQDIIELFTNSYTDLLYNLYLLQFRSVYLPPNIQSFYFDANKNLAVLELNPDNKESRYSKSTMIMFLSGGYIESFTINLYLTNSSTMELYQRIYDTVYYSETSNSTSKLIYGQFIDLPFNSKISNEGMFYLFSAWSHKIEDKEFLKEIIRFLERGQSNLSKLQPFYFYAYKKYGINFSSKRDSNNASTDTENAPLPKFSENSEVSDKGKIEELNEKISDENQKQIDQVKGASNSDVPSTFKNSKERTKFMLQKVKDEDANSNSNTNSDNSPGNSNNSNSNNNSDVSSDNKSINFD